MFLSTETEINHIGLIKLAHKPKNIYLVTQREDRDFSIIYVMKLRNLFIYFDQLLVK